MVKEDKVAFYLALIITLIFGVPLAIAVFMSVFNTLGGNS